MSLFLIEHDVKNYKNLNAEEMIGSTPLLIKKINQQKKKNIDKKINTHELADHCLLYTSPSPRD